MNERKTLVGTKQKQKVARKIENTKFTLFT